MKSLLFAVLLISGLAHAGDRNEVYAKICQKLTFDSDKTACVEKIKHYSYFESAAIDICASLSFNSDQLKCVDAIGDKQYEAFEIDTCAKLNFNSDKLACLAKNGSASNYCQSMQMALSQLQQIRSDIHYGRNSAAEARTSNLIDMLSRCQ